MFILFLFSFWTHCLYLTKCRIKGGNRGNCPGPSAPRNPSMMTFICFKSNNRLKNCRDSKDMQEYNSISGFFSLRHFGHCVLRHFCHWNISLICLTTVLKRAVKVFSNLYFQTFWPKWVNSFGHCNNIVVFLPMATILTLHHKHMELVKPFTPHVIASEKFVDPAICGRKEQKARLQCLAWAMPKSVMPSVGLFNS